MEHFCPPPLYCAGTVGDIDDEDINDDDLIDEQVRAAEEHEAEEALALADAISTHCADTVGGIDD